MIDVDIRERKKLLPLFEDIPIWKAVIYSAIESGYGIMKTNSITNPTVAVLFFGGLVLYAGNPEDHDAERITREFPVQPAILSYSPRWNNLLVRVHGEKVTSVKRYHLPYRSFSENNVRAIITSDAYKKVISIGTEDVDALHERLTWEHQFYHYTDKIDFLNNAYGCIIKENHVIVSGASAFMSSQKYKECQVNTIPAYEKQGFATVVSAAFIQKCLDHDMIIPWDAGNETSVRLGQRLGYQKVEEYVIYTLFP